MLPQAAARPSPDATKSGRAATRWYPSPMRSAPPSQLLVAGALALLLGLQPVTTDVYLPALPALTRELGASMAAAQQTMAALMLAFGLAQLVWGPLADRFGRAPVLRIGLLTFTLASLGCAAAGSIGSLIVWRIVQGACLAAAIVVARAMVRDLYAPHEGARVMSLGLSGLGVIALAGPAIGGAVAAWLGWRATLTGVALAGLAVLLFVLWRLPETLPKQNLQALQPRPLLQAWRRILGHRSFVAWATLVGCTYGGLFTVLAGSSFVFIDVLGLSPAQYGLALASCSLAYIVGTFACRRWIVRHGLAGAVRRGAGFTFAGGVLIVALAAAGVVSAWALLAPLWLYAFGHGTHQPCGQVAVVGPFPQHAGTASALAGFVLSLVAYAIGLWLGQALDGTVRPFAYGIGFWAAMTALVGWTLVQRAEAKVSGP